MHRSRAIHIIILVRVHIRTCTHAPRTSVPVHMYVCNHVPTRCSALGPSARQNSAQPYYLRFVSWLQTITHFPRSPRPPTRPPSCVPPPPPGFPPLAPPPPALALGLYLLHSPFVCLFSFLFSGFLPRSHSPFPRFALIRRPPPPSSFLLSPVTLRFPFMTVHRAQLRNGFIIELPSGMNLILF